MARSKNRRKKPKKEKMSSGSSKKRVTPAETPKEDVVDSSEDLVDYASDTNYTGGTMSGMRDLISGGGNAKDNVFSRRRSLGEWTVIFVVLGALYFVITKWFL